MAATHELYGIGLEEYDIETLYRRQQPAGPGSRQSRLRTEGGRLRHEAKCACIASQTVLQPAMPSLQLVIAAFRMPMFLKPMFKKSNTKLEPCDTCPTG